MNEELKDIASHIYDVGITALGRATYSVTFNEYMAPYAHAMSVIMGCHGAELVIKAAIAKEHPLLIFNNLYKYQPIDNSKLSYDDLIKKGKTYELHELPSVLWTATGYSVPNIKIFDEYRQMRNAITHFDVPDEDFSKATLSFIFQVMQPLIDHFWNGEEIVDYACIYDDQVVYYIETVLKRYDLLQFYRRPPDVKEEDLCN